MQSQIKDSATNNVHEGLFFFMISSSILISASMRALGPGGDPTEEWGLPESRGADDCVVSTTIGMTRDALERESAPLTDAA